jgi:dynein heavy chain, axonemal
MLGDVVVAERPEIEEKRDNIVLTMAKDSKTLKDLENNILKLLSDASTEEILDADTLIEVLQNSKKTSGEINERMEQSKIVEVEINETRNLYQNVSIRGSILYFVIADLAGIDPMYQNSLAYVKSLFNAAIAASDQMPTVEERLELLIKNITMRIFTNISRGLFEKDKLIYSFLITTSIKRNINLIDEAIWNIFLRGPTVFTPEERSAMQPSPDPIILNTINWETIYSAQYRSAGQFEGFADDIIQNW